MCDNLGVSLAQLLSCCQLSLLRGYPALPLLRPFRPTIGSQVSPISLLEKMRTVLLYRDGLQHD